ncbi:MAG: nucleoside 2-deoxyribosyltransferase domain-containing protein [Actinomycetota bacterium]|nr:nucleoside 2-deoxyribosyltransferase domain-containing protein [Actinomycetota bacterium]
MKAYIAAPLFCQGEKDFNLRVEAVVRSVGLETFLPQRDGGEAARLIRQGMDEHTVCQRLFDLDCAAIADCAVFVFVLDGRVPDEGACVELGMAFARGTPVFWSADRQPPLRWHDANNLMIDYALTGGIAASLEELADTLRTHVGQLTAG